MAKYKMLGGGIITANTPTEFAEQLRAMSFNPCESLEEYIEQTAKACLLQKGVYFVSQDAEDFLNDLIEFEFVEILDEPQTVETIERVTVERTFMDGRVEVWDYTDNPSGDLIETYQAEMPEILTMDDIKSEDAGRGFYKEN